MSLSGRSYLVKYSTEFYIVPMYSIVYAKRELATLKKCRTVASCWQTLKLFGSPINVSCLIIVSYNSDLSPY
jgi:hypothetical protein